MLLELHYSQTLLAFLHLAPKVLYAFRITLLSNGLLRLCVLNRVLYAFRITLLSNCVKNIIIVKVVLYAFRITLLSNHEYVSRFVQQCSNTDKYKIFLCVGFRDICIISYKYACFFDRFLTKKQILMFIFLKLHKMIKLKTGGLILLFF